MSRTPRYIILIIRIRYDLTVVLVWITRCPSQNIGRGFFNLTFREDQPCVPLEHSIVGNA
jgi:hypothetical protein